MAIRKGLTATQDGRAALPGFIRKRIVEDQGQVTVRIPTSLKTRFDVAQQILLANRMEMNMSDVVREALQAACTLVEQRFGTPRKEASVQNVSSFAGEHSSADTGEEWEASGDVDDKSTSTVASPLKGSSVTEEHSGVGSITDGGTEGAR